ncbi:MAG: polysaccharide biosynthesis protein, partial [Paludibacter sp.]|nr:polysaccharide biosynthesis protein [Paludibacter sp.]
AVDLVLYAFKKGKNGDLFVQKAPAATLDVLAKALTGLFKTNTPIRVIGTRHGEKLYETLVTREEMAKSEDMGDYYRIPADNRDLNYDKYFIEGQEEIATIEDYHSHNTKQLNVEEMKELLMKLEIITSNVERLMTNV